MFNLTNSPSSLITIHNHWRVIFQVAAALIGLVLLVAIFAFPETAYNRTPPFTPPSSSDDDNNSSPAPSSSEKGPATTTTTTTKPPSDAEQQQPLPIPRKRPYLSTLRLFPRGGALTTEPLALLVLRPLGLITLPPVLWAALVEASTIGFLVAMTSNVELAFSETYGFRSHQVGLCFVAAVVGSLLGIPAGGRLGDWVADWGTARAGGVRDPEHRECIYTLPYLTLPVFKFLEFFLWRGWEGEMRAWGAERGEWV